MQLARDTIAAQATPPGFGGIAIVRVSGPHVRQVITQLLKTELPPRQAIFLPFLDEQDKKIDEGIALFFPTPHSFTGEDVLELQGHGGPIVVQQLLKRLLGLGVRLARAGEFSERAFLNNKLDLAQAEAINDLIHATSEQAARSALRSLQGDFSKAIHAIIENVIYVRMYIESAIDFVEEAIDFLQDAVLATRLEQITTDLEQLLNQAKQGQLLRDGIAVVIAGEPNVGKSSLLNALSEQDIAIVTDIPGTTRDVLRQTIVIDGLPLHIIDTAGLRVSQDIVEQEGIRRAHAEIKQADLVLYVITADQVSPTEATIREQLQLANTPILLIRNKIDLIAQRTTSLAVSAKTGEGLVELKAAIKQQTGFHSESEGVCIARERHLSALRVAKTEIAASTSLLQQHRAPELAAEHLRLAQEALSNITGEFAADDLLGRIFSQFCIGK